MSEKIEALRREFVDALADWLGGSRRVPRLQADALLAALAEEEKE